MLRSPRGLENSHSFRPSRSSGGRTPVRTNGRSPSRRSRSCRTRRRSRSDLDFRPGYLDPAPMSTPRRRCRRRRRPWRRGGARTAELKSAGADVPLGGRRWVYSSGQWRPDGRRKRKGLEMSHVSAPAPVLPKRRLPGVPVAQLSLADEVATFELNALPDEVQRYLAAVDEYRRQGSAPTWRSELAEVGA
jgi:hypothetical protein